MKKLTVGLFLEHYDPFTSGVITATKALKAELKRRGHTVYVICPEVPNFKDTDPDVRRYRSFSNSALQNTTIGLPRRSDVKSLSALNFDIVHSQEVYFSDVLALRVARRLGVPFIQHYHTLWHRFLDRYHFPTHVYLLSLLSALAYYPGAFGWRALWRLVFGHTDHRYGQTTPARFMWRHMLTTGAQANLVISPSKHLLKSLRMDGLKTASAIVPNGLPPAAIRHRSSDSKPMFRVVSVARLSPEKRVEVLIKAAAETPRIHLEVIGIGPSEAELKRLAIVLNVNDRVNFVGELPNAEVRRRMAASDVLALASHGFDNQPVVIIEALSAGLPIIYCDPNLQEGLTIKNSLLVAKDAKGFSQGFKALEHRPKRRAMSQASAHLFPEFSATKMTDKILALYDETLGNYQPR